MKKILEITMKKQIVFNAVMTQMRNKVLSQLDDRTTFRTEPFGDGGKMIFEFEGTPEECQAWEKEGMGNWKQRLQLAVLKPYMKCEILTS